MKSIWLKLLCINFALVNGALVAEQTNEEVFTSVYTNAVWDRNEEGLGTSGPGSTLKTAQPYMEFLQKFLASNNIQSVADIGCGDWTFSKHVHWGDIQYTGYDVVKDVIEKNKIKFAKPTITFIHGDAVHLNLPSADLLLCKDVLQHLPLEDIQLFLTQLPKFKHCLITNDVDYTLSSTNQQVQRGGYRTLDLTKPPFNLRGTKVLTYPAGNFIKQVLYIKNEGK